MVVRLEGKLEGNDIIFQKKEGNKWECICPIKDAYEVVLELKAYDDAGNYCFKACYLVIFDPSSLVISLVPADYWLQKVIDEEFISCMHPVDMWLEYIPEIKLEEEQCSDLYLERQSM